MRCGGRRGERVDVAYGAAMVARRSGGVELGRSRTKRTGPMPDSVPCGGSLMAGNQPLRGSSRGNAMEDDLNQENSKL
jgi:hypothetical protein